MVKTFIIQTRHGAVLCPAKCGHAFFRQRQNRLLCSDVQTYLRQHAGLHRLIGFVVRDPAERLASTYVQKFVDRTLTFTKINFDLPKGASKEKFLKYALESAHADDADCHIRAYAQDYLVLNQYFPGLPLLAFGFNDELILKLTGLDPSKTVNSCSRDKTVPFWTPGELELIQNLYSEDYKLFSALQTQERNP